MLQWLPCWNKGNDIPSSLNVSETDVLLKEVGNSKEKTIGTVGGISLLINNITGPAMVTIPLLYQNAGWFTPTLCLFSMAFFGALASGFLCEAMAALPGNHHLEGRVEFSTLVRFLFGKKGLILAQIFINISLQCANVASIIECAQVADDTLIAVFGRSCGLQVYPHPKWECVVMESASDSPFSASAFYLFTIGFILMMVIVIPMGLLNLDDNIYIQVLADLFLVVVTVDFIATFIIHGINFSSVPMFKEGGQSPVLGTIMANYAFVTTIPSWCSEKKKEVNVNKSIWSATAIATFVFFALGFMGAVSFQFPSNGSILSVINASKYSNSFTKILVYLFPIMVLATTIPVFSIVVRYNLLQSEIHKGWANFLAVVLPWIVVIPFLTGNGLNDVLNWGTLFFTSIANFVIPFAVYIKACSFRKHPENLNEDQKRILYGLNLTDVLGTVNQEEEDYDIDVTTFKAIPTNSFINSKFVAIFCLGLLSTLILAAIGLNFAAL